MKAVRCAIYTRKSSDEGLEQSFNSLDAQREACAAYVLSQASEGWSASPERYDDGGISGGTLERPGLQRLLADVAAGRIDIIVGLLRQLVSSVQIERDGIVVNCTTAEVAAALDVALADDADATISLYCAVRLTRTGRAMRLVHDGGATCADAPDRSLTRLLAAAHRYWRELKAGDLDVAALAARECVSPSWVTRVLRLAFLAPEVVDAILSGRQRAGIDGLALMGSGAIDPAWAAQRKTFMPDAG